MDNSLVDYTLHLADTALIMAQRQAEWCGHGPILEQDIAITNISLDLLGQSRNFYQYAATLMGDIDEDQLAYLRKEREFKNLLLAEQPNGDWGQTILKLFFVSQFQYLLFTQLKESKDVQLAAIAEKSLKETTYHVRWSSEWVIRLGDGTAESKSKMEKAIEELWRYTGEMFVSAKYELQCAADNLTIDCSSLQAAWQQKVSTVFEEATLSLPEKVFMQSGGKDGIHTEHLGFILTELQYMQRTYPGATW